MSSLTWMAAMINKDEEDEFKRILSFIEYLASFTNAEAVKHIQELRELRENDNDEVFKKVVESLTGKEAPDFKGLMNG